MSQQKVVTSHRPLAVAELVASIGDVLNGTQTADPHGIKDAFWGAFAHSLASDIHRAFKTKSEHGTDDLGNSWPDLDPKTKAYSRPDARKGLAVHKGKPTPYGNTHRPTLTKEQDKVWRAIYVKCLTFNRMMMSGREAEESAAQQAWNYVKKHLGATTILDFASRQTVLLLQKSGRLEKSLSPGTFSGKRYEPPPEQVFRIDQTSLTWGTSVEYANRVSKKRPIWPDELDPWLSRALEAGIEAVIAVVKSAL